MVKPEWGTKRTCPKCSTRFYDLGADNPIHCLECANEWVPEPVLKSKQPLPFEAAPTIAKEPVSDPDLEAEETRAVFDRPQVLLLANKARLSAEAIAQAMKAPAHCDPATLAARFGRAR